MASSLSYCEALRKVAAILPNSPKTPAKYVYFPPLIFLHSVML
ncbi:hypothetical protein HMPREF1565_2672 [Providencia alcalifaciens RIMD 1656011]|uniref:Uncharacterized protein n=2 Tax=Providencia alcalifaciens TaxID=126385 RepID=B6XB69_9GAMM|nr:hypothetical protein PROVALCAL_00524 [Providencia alcalifaciens DSM 30120]EUC95255.1 hypothetical protein HMPREF1567_1588 [Providencia alcalifaciens PAL-2]EUD03833.1 hypothetical protein HMPREF1565_2672 [Providencia alcalifaciens RIMD 1656011]EUD08711.1 hypothetical protein HMPREF1564_3382 [Providencia alcalifaciens R90-1475]EUD12243.1 hypothetical protein HMPREF1563_1408 [Providencia alcalifaciens 205/92]